MSAVCPRCCRPLSSSGGTAPDAAGVVIKLDNSGTGIGNRVVRFADSPTTAGAAGRRRVPGAGLPVQPREGSRRRGAPDRGTSSPARACRWDIAPGRHVDGHLHPRAAPRRPRRSGVPGMSVPGEPGLSRDHLTTYGEAIGKLLADQGADGPVLRRLRGDTLIRLAMAGPRARDQLAQERHLAPFLPAAQPCRGPLRQESGVLRRPRTVLGAATESTDSLVDPAWRGRSSRTMSSTPFAPLAWRVDPRSGPARSSTCSSASKSTAVSGSRRSAGLRPTPTGFTTPQSR